MFRYYCVRLKCIIKKKENIFWSYLFPLILGTLFYFAFTNLNVIEEFETIKLAYVSENADDNLLLALKNARNSENEVMFAVKETDKETAVQMLKDKDISAYLVVGQSIEMFVHDSGLSETILKSFLDHYQRIKVSIETILKSNPNAIEQGLLDSMLEEKSYMATETKDISENMILIYLYGLIAYTCIFASSFGLDEVMNIQGNLSIQGARMNVSPVKKMKLFISNILAAITVHLGSIVLLLLYLMFGLGMSFEGKLPYVALVCILGSFLGIVIGVAIGVFVKASSQVKDAIVTGITLAGSFMAGMMLADMKALINTKVPFVKFINPVGLISDALFSISQYETYDRYFQYVGYIGVLALVIGVLSLIRLRRNSYANI